MSESDDILVRLLVNQPPKLSLTKKIYAQLDGIEYALSRGYSIKQVAKILEIEQTLFSSTLHRVRKKALEKRNDRQTIETEQNLHASNLLTNLRAKLTNNPMLDKFLAELDEIEVAIKEGFSKKQIAHELGLNPDLFWPMLIVSRQIDQENLGGEQ